MTPERWRQIEELYHVVREHQPGKRAALLDEACRGDEELRQRVESLLAQDASGKLLDFPAWEAAPSLLDQSGSLIDQPTQTIIEPGAQLGPYKIEAQIGTGGMGSVYRAIDTRLGRKVAIKIAAKQFTERFEREARAIAALNHPHVCTLYDVGPNYLVMELVEGETLAARLQKGRLPMSAVLRHAAEIADALAAGHAVGVIHRDLKPHNIMIAKSGVKVLDFGLAKSPRDQTLTASRVVMGTPAYMAPEQLESKECDARSDIFALGLVLYEMATGKRLPRGQPPLMEGLPPLQFAHVIERCLENEPENRWQSASDVKRELEWAGRTQVPTPATKSRKGLPRWLWGVAVCMLALGLGLGWTVAHLWQPVTGKRALEQRLVRLDVDLGPGVSLGNPGGGGADAILSPDGTRLVYVSQARLFTRRLDQPMAAELPGTEGARGPFFSPDGQWVAFFAQGKLKKISVEGGGAITLCDAANARGGSWGEDGSIVAALNVGDALSRIPSSGGTPTLVTELVQGEVTHRWPQVLPGAKAVMFTANTTLIGGFDGAHIDVLSFENRRRKTLHRGGTFGRYLPSGHLIYINRGTLFAVPFDLGKLEVRGTPTPLLQEVAYNAAVGFPQLDFSRTGTLVYQSGGVAGLFILQWLNAAGKTQPLLAKPGFVGRPSFSPDGQRLALTITEGSTDVWIYDLQRDIMTRLTFGGGSNDAPVWSPDGRYIAFQTPGGMSWTRADGAGKPQPLTQSKNPQFPSSFTPEGKRLAFNEVNPGTGNDLWTVPLELDGAGLRAGRPEIFLQTMFNEVDPSFSPDGRWLAYASNESGTFQVYVRAFPDRGGKWQISNSGGVYPVWSRNGREIFFETLDNRIMVSAYTMKGDSFAADKPRVWSELRIAGVPGAVRNFDLAPDGKRIAILMSADDPGKKKAQTQVIFLQNFFDEVRRRVPAGN